ncbi:MAG: amino acid ABC transporter ATP-binding protein [Clostridia bacterium]|nr:amino acid ABC transporter ATP-binding protein [Clostridia bacterium]
MNVLEVQNLKKEFNGTEIIKDISFEVKEGETLVILGPSGTGKSTILRCINNLEKVDGGNIIVNGSSMIKEYKNSKPIYNNKEILNKINLEIGMVFQDFNLFPHLTIKENIIKPLKYVLKKGKEESEEIAKKALEKMGLIDKIDSYPCELSGGQKQRAGIARSLAINPRIICMDEPTSSLDPELVGEVLKAIKQLASERKTMVIVTHEIKFAEEVADSAIFIADGKIVEEGKPEDIIRNPKEQRTKEFLKRYI